MRTPLLAALLCTAGCTGLVGNGVVVSQPRDVGAFHRVSVGSGIAATVTTGARAVTIRVDDNLQPFVLTTVENDTLVVRVNPSTIFSHAAVLEATIVNDVVEGVSASGGAHVTALATPTQVFTSNASGGSRLEVTGIAATALTLDVSGGSTALYRGTGNGANIVASGGSTVNMRSLPLQAADIDISGGSRLEARVANTLSGVASGGSTVIIAGRPATDVSTSGGASLTTGLE